MRLAFFHAAWCGVCHDKAPLLEPIATHVRVPLEQWDIETPEGAREAEARGITMVPTLALLLDERVPFRIVGEMITFENVSHLVKPYLSRDS
jgi:thiol-disulfide isomerase/thioredoxin